MMMLQKRRNENMGIFSLYADDYIKLLQYLISFKNCANSGTKRSEKTDRMENGNGALEESQTEK